MGKTTGRKKRIVITTAALLAIGGGAAFAYWTGVGTTSTAVTSGSESALTVEVTSLASGVLTPGGPGQSAEITVTNPGKGVQKLNNVVVKVAESDGSPWAAITGCSKDDFSVAATVDNVTQIEGGKHVKGTVTIQMVNGNYNQDACKGVSVPLYVSVN
ncbi:hypothetical protein [Pseudarthrobacter sp. BIM B-2242]|uniref:hypothetical protein n=1 Tax=Pseudarthrobacter sp. BIM B-2242 TaxID=2772401 RepID=UPI00168B316D|nr:hypothetical protein [Pseudarthrobacter sp. BIM B-2242]QOD02597.1 hypothetical protein IDT60_14735 [Pseudarthrobacter sp. BIM B-2242]